MPNAVLVIDMIRGFLEEGFPLYCGDKARRIIPNIQLLLERELKNGSTIFYIRDSHAPDDAEFKMFPPHCVDGTLESELIPELAAFPGEDIPKTRYSAFFETHLAEKLARLKIQKLIVCGVCTDICVLHTIAEARNRNYDVEVPMDCVASFNEKSHLNALEHMEKILGAKLTCTRQIPPRAPKFEVMESVLSGDTADVYFVRTMEILRREGINPTTTTEIFPSRDGMLCGLEEIKVLLERVLPENNRQVWTLDEGAVMSKKEVVLRITAPYQSYGLYETAILGTLAHGSGWATAASECVAAARGIPVISFGARHVHPRVTGMMDYAAIIGGCAGCSSTIGAKLTGIVPSGTIPHTLVLIIGDTVKATQAFDRHIPPEIGRVALVDTFKDEVEESLRVAEALGERLASVRLDTPEERGRVTWGLVKEARVRLDLAGFKQVKIFVSGGIDPKRIGAFLENGAPVDGFGVGSYITGGSPIDFTADLHEIDGRPIAKRGRIPGITPNPRLKQIM